MSTIKVNNITTYSGSYLQIAKNTEVTGTLRISSNVSGTADLYAHRISGSEAGMSILGAAIFSNNASVSGSIIGATTISGAGAMSAASLTIGGVERISQNGNAIFQALTADTLDVREINNSSVTTTTLEA